MGVCQSHIGHPAEDLAKDRLRLKPRERSTHSAVNSGAERDVLLTVGSIEPEFVGFLKDIRIAVGRPYTNMTRSPPGMVTSSTVLSLVVPRPSC